MSSQALYEMKTFDWWEFVDWLKSAQERGYVTDLDFSLLFPDEEQEDEEPSERMLEAGTYVFGLMEMMGLQFLDSETMKPVDKDNGTGQ